MTKDFNRNLIKGRLYDFEIDLRIMDIAEETEVQRAFRLAGVLDFINDACITYASSDINTARRGHVEAEFPCGTTLSLSLPDYSHTNAQTAASVVTKRGKLLTAELQPLLMGDTKHLLFTDMALTPENAA